MASTGQDYGFGPVFRVEVDHKRNGQFISINRNTSGPMMDKKTPDTVDYHIKTNHDIPLSLTKAQLIEFFQDAVACMEACEAEFWPEGSK